MPRSVVGLLLLTCLASVAGCPGNAADDSGRTLVATAISAGDYSGQEDCTTSLQPTGTRGFPLNRASSAGLDLSIDPAGSLVVGGTQIEPGVMVQAGTPDVTVSQHIDAIEFLPERVTVNYTASIAFSADGEDVQLVGFGSYEIVGSGPDSLRYSEHTELSFSDTLRGFAAVLDCTATMHK